MEGFVQGQGMTMEYGAQSLNLPFVSSSKEGLLCLHRRWLCLPHPLQCLQSKQLCYVSSQKPLQHEVEASKLGT